MSINVELLRTPLNSHKLDLPTGFHIFLTQINPDDYALLEETDLPDYDDLSYPYLRLIDPYGETIFAGHQMAAVIPELERLAAARGSRNVEAALAVARRCVPCGAHLAFLGD